MADSRFVVQARFEGDSSGAVRASKQFQRSLDDIGGSLKSAVAGIAGFEALRRAFTFAVTEASEAEDAALKLSLALNRLGPDAEAAAAALTKQANALAATTRFQDDAITSAQTRLASVASSREEIESLTVAAADLAAALGISVEDAAAKLATALTSAKNPLKSYGITTDGAAKSSERLASVIDGVAERFGGQAAAAAQTFGGIMARLANQFGEVAESIGGGIIENDRLRHSFESLIGFLSDPGTVRAISSFGALLGDVLGGIVGVVHGLSIAFDELIGQLVQMVTPLEGIEANTAALEATAKRLGITVDEVRARMDAARTAVGAMAQAEEAAAVSTRKITVELDKLAKATTATKGPAEFLSELLGVQSSIALESQIIAIGVALDGARQSGEFTFQELAAKAEEANRQMEALRERADRLKQGLPEIAEAADAGLGTATDQAERFTDQLAEARLGTDSVRAGLVELGAQATRTAVNFDALARSATAAALAGGASDRSAAQTGRSVAVQAALDAGGRLTQGGSRVRLPGGGSRLTSSFSQTGVFASQRSSSSVSSDGRIGG